jgi:hypothetical protein
VFTGSALGCIVDPPKPGQPSYAQWFEERQAVYASLQRRAKIVRDTLNQLKGVSCQTVEGALYAFPTITIPKKAVEAAKSIGMFALRCMLISLIDVIFLSFPFFLLSFVFFILLSSYSPSIFSSCR